MSIDDALAAFAESEDRGEPWIYPRSPDEEMAADMPNPFVIRCGSPALTTGKVKGDEVTFLNGVDLDGKKWSRLLGARVLKDTLIHGIEKEWDDDRGAFVETGRVGPVEPGDLVSIRYAGWKEVMSGPNKGQLYPDLKVNVQRHAEEPPHPADDPDADSIADEQQSKLDDDIPF